MQLSDAEWRLMEALWKGAPASARDLLERLGPKAGWAYTTVKTMLTRLAEKGAVAEEMEGNVALYEPKVTRLAARRTAVRSLVTRAFGGAYGAFVHHLMRGERLSAKERAKLRKMLEELGGADAGGHGGSEKAK
jgi:BlaI family penicillinase repressor